MKKGELAGDCSHVKTLKTNMKEDNNNLKSFTASVREMFNNIWVFGSVHWILSNHMSKQWWWRRIKKNLSTFLTFLFTSRLRGLQAFGLTFHMGKERRQKDVDLHSLSFLSPFLIILIVRSSACGRMKKEDEKMDAPGAFTFLSLTRFNYFRINFGFGSCLSSWQRIEERRWKDGRAARRVLTCILIWF